MTYAQPFFPLLLFVALAAGWYAVRRSSRRAARVCFGALLGILLWSAPPVHWLLVWPIERGYLSELPEPMDVQAIVILSGGSRSPGPHSSERQPTYATYIRCQRGAELYRSLRTVPIIVTGGYGEAEVMTRLLQGAGIPGDRIIVEPKARNTWENASFTARILKARGWHRIALVTEAYHMPRSVRAFRRHGLSVVPVACGFVTHRPLWRELLPDGSTIRRNELLAHELIGIIWYEIRARWGKDER